MDMTSLGGCVSLTRGPLGRRDPWTRRLSAFFAVAGFPVVAGVPAVNGLPDNASFPTVAVDLRHTRKPIIILILEYRTITTD
jgi:hypothetical protein